MCYMHRGSFVGGKCYGMVCACAAVSNNKSLQLTLSYLLHFVFVLSHADSYSVTVLTWNSMGNSEILDK